MSENVLLTLRTHSLSCPAGAGAELGQLVGRVVSSTVLSLMERETIIYQFMVSDSQFVTNISIIHTPTTKRWLNRITDALCPLIFGVRPHTKMQIFTVRS